MNNTKLYFKGLIARIIQVVGGILLSIGFFLILIFNMFNHNKIWVGVIVGILGGLILVCGNALRFDFKRESGYIIYNK